MSRIGFIGLGNMGLPMARNLAGAGHEVLGFDLAPAARKAAEAAGLPVPASAAEAVRNAEVVITMLPEGRHVRSAYLDPDGVLACASPGTQLIDGSTIDVATARAVEGEARARGLDLLDAPVSGGVGGAEGATLTFMVGGSEAGLERSRPLFEAMGKTIVHCGPSGTGQAAKICNNMILGISMIGVSEAFTLAEALGLDAQKLFDVASRSSGQCWSLTSYCPVPGPVPNSPANRGYQPGFTTAMMAKDLRLAQAAALSADVATPLGAEARSLYALFARKNGELDFSAIVQFLRRST
jgi:3-hydroxyisobutyrate dehydrogenase